MALRLRFDIKKVSIIAKKRGGKLLSKKYKDARTPMEWKCKEGHTWKTSLMAIRNNGSWCPFCSGKAKKTLSYCKQIAKQKGGKCLSHKYLNNKSKMRWQCKCGHKWITSFSKIQSGTWCPECAIKKNNDQKRGSIKDIKKLAKDRGGKLISTKYITARKNLIWECKMGHRWKSPSGRIKSGSWCPQCKGSRGERICRIFMEKLLQTKFPKSYPKWLKISKNTKLELDGYAPNIALAFEHQGEQHFTIHRRFSTTNDSLNKRKKYDNFKRKKCKEYGVTLIEIPEIGKKLKLTEIESYLRKELKKNKIHVLRKNPIIINQKDIYTPEDKIRYIQLKKIARSKGGMLLTPTYLGQKEKHLWQCKKRHKWEATAESIHLQNTWCAVCSKKAKHTLEELKKAARNKNGQLLDKVYKGVRHSYTWKCKANHQFKNSGENILKGQWCGKCYRTKPNKSRMSPIICSNGVKFESIKAAAKKYKLNPGSIVRLLQNGKKKKSGLGFKYLKRQNKK